MTGVVVLIVIVIVVALAVTRPVMKGEPRLPALKVNWRTELTNTTPCTWCRAGNCGACEDPTCSCFEMHVAQATGVEPARR